MSNIGHKDMPMWVIKEVYEGDEGIILKVIYDGSYVTSETTPRVGQQLVLLADGLKL